MSQNLPSAAVVIGALRVNEKLLKYYLNNGNMVVQTPILQRPLRISTFFHLNLLQKYLRFFFPNFRIAGSRSKKFLLKSRLN